MKTLLGNYEKKVLTVMVNNSTNFNKMNNHFSTQTIEYKKKNMMSDIGNPGLSATLGQAKQI